MTPSGPDRNLTGALLVMAAMLFFSTNDVGIKWLSGDYALHQVVLIRSLIGTAFFLSVILPLSGGFAALRTGRLRLHLLRGLCVVFANMCYFLALAAIPIADAVAVMFISPLLLAMMSAVLLKEHVGPWRWGAILVGLIGVMIMVRPGGDGFRMASLLPLAAACGYASLHILTRHMRDTESATTMAFYIQVTFIATSGLIGLGLGHGQFASDAHPSVQFLLRGWSWPASSDWPVLALIGVGSVLGGWAISEGYRRSQAAFAAPFEYVAMPLAVIWGFLFFGDWPDPQTWVGIALIVGAGLFLLWRETRIGRPSSETLTKR